MDPGTTEFFKTTLYAVDDISAFANTPGQHVLEVWLGNCWYGMHRAFNQTPKLRLEMFIDGNSVVATNSSSWITAPGPIVLDSIYAGETYDETKEVVIPPNLSPIPPWVRPETSSNFNPVLRPRIFPPIRKTSVLLPAQVWSPDNGTIVFDFGRLLSGFCEIDVRASHGRVQLRHGEILDHYHTNRNRYVYFDNLRSAEATDTLLLKNTTKPVMHSFTPRFTYHGFRFVELTWSGDARVENISAVSIHTDVKQISQFSTDNPMINKLHQHILWGQLGNLMSYPTDCNQRDERLGWMADGWLSSDEAYLNFDMAEVYKSWLAVMVEVQLLGAVPDVVPFVRYGVDPADPSWGLALPYLSLLTFLETNDTSLLGQLYPHCASWFELLSIEAAVVGLKHMVAYYGDWVPPPPAKSVSKSFAASWALLYTNVLLLRMAGILNLTSDVEKYNASLGKLKTAFNAAWYNATVQQYDSDAGGVQSSFVLPMSIGQLVPPQVALGLLHSVETAGYHLDTGILGLRFLFESLSALNSSDVALALITQTTYPSYAWEWSGENETPATALWEVWNAPSRGPGMNSRNHIMDGSVDTWIHEHIAGFRRSRENHRIVIHPSVLAHLTPVSYVAYQRQHSGILSFSWRKSGGVRCIQVMRPDPIEIACGKAGGIIDSIEFASVGAPFGICAAYQYAPNWHRNASLLASLHSLCLGRSSCRITNWFDPARDRMSVAAIVRASCSLPASLDVFAAVSRNMKAGILIIPRPPDMPLSAKFLNVLHSFDAAVSIKLRKDVRNFVVDFDASQSPSEELFSLNFSVAVVGKTKPLIVSSKANPDCNPPQTFLECPRGKVSGIYSVRSLVHKGSLAELRHIEARCIGSRKCMVPNASHLGTISIVCSDE